MLGQDHIYPAVPPGLMYVIHPLMHTIICGFFLRRITSAPILFAFLFALRSPFGSVFFTAFHHAAALFERVLRSYLLSLIGLFIYKTISSELSTN